MITIQEQTKLAQKIMENFHKSHPELGYTSNNIITNLITDNAKNYIGIAILYTISELAETDRITKDLNSTKKEK